MMSVLFWTEDEQLLFNPDQVKIKKSNQMKPKKLLGILILTLLFYSLLYAFAWAYGFLPVVIAIAITGIITGLLYLGFWLIGDNE